MNPADDDVPQPDATGLGAVGSGGQSPGGGTRTKRGAEVGPESAARRGIEELDGADSAGGALEPGGAEPASRPAPRLPDGPLPIRMMADRLLVLLDAESADRRSAGGILIPVTASVGKRLAWAFVVALGTNVRHVKMGERILFDPSDRAEVELQGQTYLLLRERDIHGVAEQEEGPAAGGLYL
ncbi:MAG: co-chaperone GroES [Bifidobacteriaceae bacterium]|nr:co-chaperone GroES [Bifidobacteriaceae bacterium]